MEAKLAAYRRRKEKEKQPEQSLINKLKLVITNRSKEAESEDQDKTEDSSQKNYSKALVRNEQLPSVKRKSKQHIENPKQQEVEIEVDSTNTAYFTKWTLTILKFLLWLTIWGLFIELQFGAVFFAISVLIFVYMNTRTGPKDNKPSAYSVFNKDCERIQGTLTAEQMQKSMFGVPGLPS